MDKNVYLFVPNIIGYTRILLALLSFYYMPSNHVLASFYYIVSQFLDALDGHAARYLNQASRFGAMLDQLTDRCSTLCLLLTLGHFYPRWMLFFQLSAALDIASHWLHLHASDIGGGKHYKNIEVKNLLTKLLHFYYTSRPFLFFMCAGNELFWCMLYLQHFTTGPFGIFTVFGVLAAPISFLKSFISLVHLIQAANNIVDIDTKDREAAAKTR